MASAAQDSVIEFYRPRLIGRVLLAWMSASILLGIGVSALAVALDESGRVPPGLRAPALAAGVLGTVLGAVGGIFGIIRLVSRDDSYLLVRQSGIFINSGRSEVFIPWAALEGATVEQGAVVLRRQDDGPLRLEGAFQGIRNEALASRLVELRRRALLGALSPPRPAPPRR